MYEAGIETKEKIYKAAKKVFYKKGFLKATISEISSLGKVNDGLIHYYYENKMNLAMEIYREIEKFIRNELKTKVLLNDPNDSVMLMAVELKVYNKLQCTNKNFRKFNKEICDKDQYFLWTIVLMQIFLKRFKTHITNN